MKTKQITLIGLMAALMCICGPISIPLPFSPVPISLTILSLYLAAYVLGMKYGFFSFLVYFLLGIVGLPIFAGFSGGAGIIAGPTGGYIIGYFFIIIIVGYCIEKWPTNKWLIALSMILSLSICYTLGTYWLSAQLSLSFMEGLAMGVIPFIPGDIIKIVIALILGPILRKSLQHMN